MNKICIYCGSSTGSKALYRKSARELGTYLAGHHIGLVYGGAGIGLMGDVADATLQAGGDVTGVITELLAKEVKHKKLTEMIIVDSMHARKTTMFELSDAFIALPGGFGTLEELFEVITWAQLGIHNKPVGLLNVDGYFDKLLDFLEYSVEQQFVKRAYLNKLIVRSDAASMINAFSKCTLLRSI